MPRLRPALPHAVPPATWPVVLALLTLAPSTPAGDLIFSDDFETGDTSAWTQTVGLPELPACITGAAPADAFEGDLGPEPGGSFDELGCVEMVNDLPVERRGEPATSSIALARDLGLTSTDGLALVGPGGRLVPAQFDVVSRWAGTVDDVSRPIRWLGITTPPTLAANSLARYALRRYATPPTTGDPYAVTVTPAGPLQEVDTGVATFTLDPTNPALFDGIAIDFDDDGSGRTTIYQHQPGAGPRLDFDPGGGVVVLDTNDPARVLVDDFRIVETGPVKAVVALRGRFAAPAGTSLCSATNPPYERFGYTLVATFVRARRDVLLEWVVRNSCSDAASTATMDQAITIDRASWEFPLASGLDGVVTTYHAGATAVAASTPGFVGETVVEQRKGAGSPWLRRARVQRDGASLETAEVFERPLLALADDTLVAALQMPWMRYREPQALAADGTTLGLRPISEPLVVGEGKGLWSRALLTLRPLATVGGALGSYLEAQRDTGTAELERGLLVRGELERFNEAALFPSLGSDLPSPLITYYTDTLGFLHQQTIEPGGQWDIAKTYGSQVWPDVQFDQFFPDWGEPTSNPVASNYWNPSGAELFELLRTGDPRWAWDFALPQAWLQSFSAHLDTGEQFHGNRNGLSVSGTGTGEGHWHRAGDLSSDDYNYNYGLQLAYALRPSPALLDRIGQAGKTVTDRYDVPQANQGDRDPFVNGVFIGRNQIQHFEHLANCAEFVSGTRGADCRARLLELVAELAEDNLGSGVFCVDDVPSGTACSTPQQFMTNAHFYPFFHRVWADHFAADPANTGLANTGPTDTAGRLRRALVEMPRTIYDWLIPKQGDGVSIDVGGDWEGGLDCTLTADRTDVVSCAGWVGEDPTFFENRPHTVALLLAAQELDPTLGLCQISRDALADLVTADALGGYVGEDQGWWKGSSQMMQALIFALGGDEGCFDAPRQPRPPG